MTDNNQGRSVGDEYREHLTDLDWVRDADAVQLRVALHALCWRCERSTVDAFASDPVIARKVLIVARGIRDELEARIKAAREEGSKNVMSLLRRRASAETIVSTCDAAIQLRAVTGGGGQRGDELMRAIARHAEAIAPEDACDADRELWRVLEEAPAAS
ncbi:hypothetical protein H7J07_04765 [Mycobacterium koreense]|nr:hypothetical protein [Mycolicibacillus koreensis]MCV7247569.1 hypothetical protein [Mycolicibacillus koreensis]BBY53948.1 hypothetical protein MKOR_11990 [Mycolicibacillus koreensis]